MSITTAVDGRPATVESAADWLRSTLHQRVCTAVDVMYGARTLAQGDWESPAGTAFVERLSDSASHAEELASAAGTAAALFDDFAAALRHALAEMARIRDEAAAAGLAVRGSVISHPGPAPHVPPAPTGDAATTTAVADHSAAVLAAEKHAQQAEAYNRADAEAAGTRDAVTAAADVLAVKGLDVFRNSFFTIGDLLVGGAQSVAATQSTLLRRGAEFAITQSHSYAELARTAPAGTMPELLYRDVDTARAFAAQADDALARAGQVDTAAKGWGLRAGGLLTAGAVAYDIVNGKPAVQAVASGGAGFAASVGTGVAIGAVIGGPPGLIVGAAAGAVVGVFTSGAVDSLFTNGATNVSAAFASGASAVGDTGQAIGSLIKEGWDAVF